MSATYWVAKYVQDVFRDEPCNIGVFVEYQGVMCARLVGEDDNGVYDEQSVRGILLYPKVYAQWRSYWREAMTTPSEFDQKIFDASNRNFDVVCQGQISDVGYDSARQICDFAYRLLVSDGRSCVETFICLVFVPMPGGVLPVVS